MSITEEAKLRRWVGGMDEARCEPYTVHFTTGGWKKVTFVRKKELFFFFFNYYSGLIQCLQTKSLWQFSFTVKHWKRLVPPEEFFPNFHIKEFHHQFFFFFPRLVGTSEVSFRLNCFHASQPIATFFPLLSLSCCFIFALKNLFHDFIFPPWGGWHINKV